MLLNHFINYREIPIFDFFKIGTDYFENNLKIKIPEWINEVKSGVGKKNLPEQKNFGLIRLVSIFRKFGKYQEIGIKKLSSKFSYLQRRGVKPPKYRKSGRKILRTLCWILEEKKLIEKKKIGRRLTSYGNKTLNEITKIWLKKEEK